MPQSDGFLVHENPNIIIVLDLSDLTPKLAGIISICRQYLNRNDNLMYALSQMATYFY